MRKFILSNFLLFCTAVAVLAQNDIETMFLQSFDLEPAKAKEVRDNIIRMAPESQYAAYCRGWLLTKEGNYDEALSVANNLIERFPDFPYAYMLRGNCLYYKESYSEAIAMYNKVIALNPTEIGGYHNRGLCKYYLDDYRGAIQDYNSALAINPNFPNSYYRMGMAKVKLGLIDAGCLDLSKAGELGYVQAYDEIKKSCQ